MLKIFIQTLSNCNMKKFNQTNEKLAARLTGYAASAGALLALVPAVNAQVVYSGPQNIELNLPDDYMQIDIDGDMVDDFTMVLQGYNYTSSFGPYYYKIDIAYGAIVNARTDSYKNSWLTRVSTINSSVSGPYGSSSIRQENMVDGLDLGEVVDPVRSSWANQYYVSWPAALGLNYSVIYRNSYYSASYYIHAGEFPGNEKFIGVRFYIGTEQYYGWIRVNLASDFDPLTILDWAYESKPDTLILAGDGLGIDLPPSFSFSIGSGSAQQPTQTLAITATESILGFDESDLNITNGTADNFTEVTPGIEYTVDITAAAEGKVTVEIPDSSVTDLAANENMAVSKSWYYDTSSPVPQMTLFDTDPTSNIYVTVLMEFNEKIKDFNPLDINVTNGLVDYVYSYGDDKTFFIDVFSDTEGLVTVEMPEGSVTDLAGNENEGASISWTLDLTPPEITLDAGVTTTSEPVVTLDVTASEIIQGLELEDFMVDNGSATMLQHISGNMHYQVDITAADAGIVLVELPDNSVLDAVYLPNTYASAAWLYEPVGLNPVTDDGIQIYPNPVSSLLSIELKNSSNVKLIDMKGNVVFQQENLLNETIDVHNFARGIYVVQIQNDAGITQHKIILE
jgi:hypothetical protein